MYLFLNMSYFTTMLLNRIINLLQSPLIRPNNYKHQNFNQSFNQLFKPINTLHTLHISKTNNVTIFEIPKHPIIKYSPMIKRYYSDTNKFHMDNKSSKSYYSKETIMDTLNSLKNDIKKTTYVTEFNEIVNNVIKEMERKKISMLKIKITIGILILIIILALYDVITNWMSGQVNFITEKSLDDEVLKQKLIILCKDTIKELVHSNEVQDDVTELLKVAVINLTKDKEIQDQITELLRVCVIDLTIKKEIQDSVTELLKVVTNDLTQNVKIEKSIRQLLTTIIENASKDEQVHNHGGKIISGSLYNAFFSKK